LLKAHRHDSSLGLDAAIKHMETQYREVIRQNDHYLSIEKTLQQRVESSLTA